MAGLAGALRTAARVQSWASAVPDAVPGVAARVHAKRVVFVRHAEAEHNAAERDGHLLRDPPLTELGRAQARALVDALRGDPLALAKLGDGSGGGDGGAAGGVEQGDGAARRDVLVFSSPLLRTLETTHALLPALNAARAPVVVRALSELQECGYVPCDTGSSVEEVEEAFHALMAATVGDDGDPSASPPPPPTPPPPPPLPHVRFDTSALAADWFSFRDAEHKRADTARRVRAARVALLREPAATIIVVSHSAFLRSLLGSLALGNAEFVVADIDSSASVHLLATNASAWTAVNRRQRA